jgi:hypothetical protein
MRSVSQSQLPIALPMLLVMAAAGGSCFVAWKAIATVPAWARMAWVMCGALPLVGGMIAVLLGAMRKEGQVCGACGGKEAFKPEEERLIESAEQAAKEEQMRGELTESLRPQIEGELRPQLSAELHPQIEAELRPQLEEEIRTSLEAELRPQIEAELRPEIETQVEARLRPEIEKQVRAAVARTQAVPVQSAPPARAVGSPPPGPRPMPPPQLPAAAARAPSGAMPAVHAAAPQASGGAGVAVHSPVGSAMDPHAKAQRRARVIVSDIALYHKEQVQSAARSSDPRKALDTLWDEAMRTYNESVSEDVRRGTNYLADAFDALVQKTRKELNLA